MLYSGRYQQMDGWKMCVLCASLDLVSLNDDGSNSSDKRYRLAGMYSLSSWNLEGPVYN